ncbi:MAG: AbrB/MazE/SpoVT family DNA-binding domain-containing protein [Armatimonadota bacterium]
MSPKLNPEEYFLGTVTVGERGQIVIPADARKKLGIHTGQRLLAICNPSQDGIVFLKAEAMREFINHLNTTLNMADKYDSIEKNIDSEDNDEG